MNTEKSAGRQIIPVGIRVLESNNSVRVKDSKMLETLEVKGITIAHRYSVNSLGERFGEILDSTRKDRSAMVSYMVVDTNPTVMKLTGVSILPATIARDERLTSRHNELINAVAFIAEREGFTVTFAKHSDIPASLIPEKDRMGPAELAVQ